MAAALVMVCARRSWVSVCRPAAVFHGRLIALAQWTRSFARALVATPFQSVHLPPRPEHKVFLALANF